MSVSETILFILVFEQMVKYQYFDEPSYMIFGCYQKLQIIVDQGLMGQNNVYV